MPTPTRQSRFIGCLLGLALGDALGAPYEGGLPERLLWSWIGRTKDGKQRYTDDTQMALDLAQSLTERGVVDPDHIAAQFAAGYRWSRGYGPGAARTLKAIKQGLDWRIANTSVYSQGSYGNGAAMRAPVIGLFCADDLPSLPAAARVSARITHAHPLGEEAATLVALATSSLALGRSAPNTLAALLANCSNHEFRHKLQLVEAWLPLLGIEPELVRRQLGNGVAATDSCVTAIYVALRFLDAPFEQLLRFAAACRGDVDTIGAMAGALWGSRNGVEALPAAALGRIEAVDRITEVAVALFQRVQGLAKPAEFRTVAGPKADLCGRADDRRRFP